jgi:hypothetical protein
MEDETEEGVLAPGCGSLKVWKDKEGRHHRLAGPAVIYIDGDTYWFIHGTMHRDDGPARIWDKYGIEKWYKDGEEYEPSAHEIMVWKMTQHQA